MLLSLALAFLLAAAAPPAAAPQADIPFDTFTLPNGLTVVVHEDHKAPIVAVNVWYRVGSKDEPAGRTGFAHLFEHLMFQRSENHPDEFFKPFEKVGATDQNGTTNTDRTNYFENVPTTALDVALWMESDRMGHLLGAIDQGVLDEQRGVVQNEKRQGENQPYGEMWDVLGRTRYPAGHPYSWSTIGSMADLNAATLEDVRAWFTNWYGPNNAVLVLAGDIDRETAEAKVTRYFGDIPASPDLPRRPANPAPLQKATRVELKDQVPQVRILRAWNVAEFASADSELLELAASVLGGLSTSRLDTRLVHEEKVVDRIGSWAMPGLLGGTVIIQADVKSGVDVARVEALVEEEVQRLLRDGPSQDELARARIAAETSFVRGIERIGGFGGKADVLAQCATFTGDPGCFRQQARTIREATVEQVADAARRWLSRGSATVVVSPGERAPQVDQAPTVAPTPLVAAPPDPKYRTVPSDLDRSKGVPETTSFPALTFPAIERATLPNGLRVVLARRPGLPLVQLMMDFAGGYSTDPPEQRGLASFAAGLLDEGAGGRDVLAFGRAAEDLGAAIGASAGNDFVRVSMSTLEERLDPSMALMADVVLRPAFAESEIERVRKNVVAAIRQAEANPNAKGRTVVTREIFGPDHPYAVDFGGQGTEQGLSGVDRDDLVAWRSRWLRPDNATAIIVGDLSLDEAKAAVAKHFGSWKAPKGKLRVEPPPMVQAPAKPKMILIDHPGAQQANLFAGRVAVSSMDPQQIEVNMTSQILCGEFTSRLNMNLREEKHWSYGAYCGAGGARGPRAWVAHAPVQSDMAIESLKEMRREIDEYASGRAPATAAELGRMVDNNIRGLPGSYETGASVLDMIASMERLGRPDDYPTRLAGLWTAVTPSQVQDQARSLSVDKLTWVVVGDADTLEAPLKALGWADVEVQRAR